jgi:hypothetical protein
MTARRQTHASAVLDAPAVDPRTDDELQVALEDALLTDDEATIDAIEAEQDRRQQQARRTEARERAEQRRTRERAEQQRRARFAEARAEYADCVAQIAALATAIGEVVGTLLAKLAELEALVKRAYVAAHAAGHTRHHILSRKPQGANWLVRRILRTLDVPLSAINTTNDMNRAWRHENGREFDITEVLAMPALPPEGSEEG